MKIVQVAYAETIPLLENIKSDILNPIITLLLALSLVLFLYGVYEMVKGAGSEEARATGQRHIIWGVVGLFIGIAAFGIIHTICYTIGVNCR